VSPLFEEQGIPLLRVLTDRVSERCGAIEHHEYQLYLAVEDIDHSKTKARRPQTSGICERFHRTMKDEFYSIAFGKKVYHTLVELQRDVDEWLLIYNYQRSHSERYCYGKPPLRLMSGHI
jgi:transposase InsO family protein